MSVVSMGTNPLAGYVGARAADLQSDYAAQGNKNKWGAIQQLYKGCHDSPLRQCEVQNGTARTGASDLANSLPHLEYR